MVEDVKVDQPHRSGVVAAELPHHLQAVVAEDVEVECHHQSISVLKVLGGSSLLILFQRVMLLEVL